LGKGHTLAIPREPTTTSKLRTNLDAARRKFEAKRVEKLKQDARSAAVTSRHGKHSASSSGGKTKKTAVDICSIYLKGAMYPLEKAPAEVRFFLNLIYNLNRAPNSLNSLELYKIPLKELHLQETALSYSIHVLGHHIILMGLISSMEAVRTGRESHIQIMFCD